MISPMVSPSCLIRRILYLAISISSALVRRNEGRRARRSWCADPLSVGLPQRTDELFRPADWQSAPFVSSPLPTLHGLLLPDGPPQGFDQRRLISRGWRLAGAGALLLLRFSVVDRAAPQMFRDARLADMPDADESRIPQNAVTRDFREAHHDDVVGLHPM